MEKYKYYTPIELAECLMELIPQRKYEKAIDICCGSWNLLKAAKTKLNVNRFIGVDIEKTAKEVCIEEAIFYCQDGREFALNEAGKYDLILSNPPFGYLNDKQRKFQALEYGINHIISHKRYEMEMLQANLLLSKHGGILLFILPATFFEGETYLLARREVCENYFVDTIIKLPENTFGNTDICTYALVLQNIGGQKNGAQLQEAFCQNGEWKLRFIQEISQKNMREGRWLREKKSFVNSSSSEIFRGNISSCQFSESGEQVFHNSSSIYDGKWVPSIRYCSDKEIAKRAKKVFPGDVMINRVGRGVNYWCLCEEEGLVSDCIFVIKNAKDSDIYDKLEKQSVGGKLGIASRGVTTKYITKRDILDIIM